MFIFKALNPDSLEEYANRDQGGGKDGSVNKDRFYSFPQLEQKARREKYKQENCYPHFEFLPLTFILGAEHIK
jgi:hypothetical protein